MVDGVPLAKAFRHREIMLLQAVAEKYGKVSLRIGGRKQFGAADTFLLNLDPDPGFLANPDLD